MDLSTVAKDVQLKLALTNTDLHSAFRAAVGLERFSTKKENSLSNGKSDLLACYSAKQGTLTLTGVFRHRFPIRFTLKPGSQSYSNVIRFLLEELDNLEQKKVQEGEIDRSCDYQDAVDNLRLSLEDKLCALDRETKAVTANLNDIVEIFSDDFEKQEIKVLKVGREKGKLKPLRSAATVYGRSVIRELKPRHRQFRLFPDGGCATSQLISGFLSLEIQEYSKPKEEAEDEIDLSLAKQGEPVQSDLFFQLNFIEPVRVTTNGESVEVYFSLYLPENLRRRVDILVHWGKLSEDDGINTLWVDEEVTQDELSFGDNSALTVRKILHPEKKGLFGLTCAVVLRETGERIWASQFGFNDCQFEISNQPSSVARSAKLDVVENIDVKGKLLQSLASFENFLKTVTQLARSTDIRGLGKLLFDVTKDSAALRSLISEYYHRAVELEKSSSGTAKSKLKTLLGVLRNIGIGEIVFIAPEGPHAIAGGLAQVIVGLTKSLSRFGISCTVISPLYEEEQGNKHTSAEKLLNQGIQLLGKVVPVRLVGQVAIPFGPVYRQGSSKLAQHPRLVHSQVYQAENEGVRIFFLRHPRWANRLYASGLADEQIRRSIFLSRGALEIVRNRSFNIAPHILITNDWPTALVPVLLRTDSRYQNDPRLCQVETMHIMHNCGRDYQGRFLVNQFGQDLYPLLGIGGEHFFGMLDPEDHGVLNFTAAAAYHSSRALLAVSKPYARQLLTKKGGEGLSKVFVEQSQLLFGISNGVDLSALRNIFWQLGETARNSLGLEPLIRKRFNVDRLIRKLPEYKRATKLVVQEKYGLHRDPESFLICLVGRLAEQKGIQLLSGKAQGSTCSVVEDILNRYPKVQFLIGGPPMIGDPCVHELEALLADLEDRFQGRVKSVFDFIPHRNALEITEGSDIFLMPSRYEPGGITQLEAMAAGTVVVARNVGGIAATLSNYCPIKEEGNSFLFKEFTSTALERVIISALDLLQDEKKRHKLINRVAGAESDWSHRVPKYLSIFQHVAGVFEPQTAFEYLAPRFQLLNSLRPA